MRQILERVNTAKDELQRYVQESGLVDDDEEEVAGKVRRWDDGLNRWCWQQLAFPCLVRLAVKNLDVPPTLAASECISSMAGRMFTKMHNRLGHDTLDALVFPNGSEGRGLGERGLEQCPGSGGQLIEHVLMQ